MLRSPYGEPAGLRAVLFCSVLPVAYLFRGSFPANSVFLGSLAARAPSSIFYSTLPSARHDTILFLL